jgi:hypothetical protein
MQAGKAVFSWRLFVDDGYFDVVEVAITVGVSNGAKTGAG